MNIETIISKIRNALGEGVDKVSDEVEKSQVFEKFEDSDDKVAKILDDAGKALTSLFDTIADKAEPMIKKTKAKIYEGILDAAGADLVDVLQVAQGGNIQARGTGGLQNGGALRHGDGSVVDGQRYHLMSRPPLKMP